MHVAQSVVETWVMFVAATDNFPTERVHRLKSLGVLIVRPSCLELCAKVALRVSTVKER